MKDQFPDELEIHGPSLGMVFIWMFILFIAIVVAGNACHVYSVVNHHRSIDVVK